MALTDPIPEGEVEVEVDAASSNGAHRRETIVHRLNSIDAALEQVGAEQRTQAVQLLLVTAMIGAVAGLVYWGVTRNG